MIIALTGGIGSGKSTVAGMLREKGYRVVSSDAVASELLEKGQANHEAVLLAFGEGILDEGGNIDKEKLRGIVFKDPKERRKLNEISHKNIMAVCFDRVSQDALAFIEVPLLFEERLESYFDESWLLDCSRETQKKRVLERGSLEESEVDRILDAQLPREEKLKRAKVVLDGEASLLDLERAVDALLVPLEQQIGSIDEGRGR